MKKSGGERFLLFSHPEGVLVADLVLPQDETSLPANKRSRATKVCRLALPTKRFGAASVRGGAEMPGLHVVAVPAGTVLPLEASSIDDLLPLLRRDRYVAFVAFG